LETAKKANVGSDIQQVISGFRKACKNRPKTSGILPGIQIHLLMGYLLSEFLSPRTTFGLINAGG